MSFTVNQHYYGPASYRKARPASLSSSSNFQSIRRRTVSSQRSSTDSVDVFTVDRPRRNEKEVLQTLNDRFAGYIDKVRNLEMHNMNLEAEAAELRQKQTGGASVGEHYDRELGDLRGLVQQLTGEKARAVLEHERLEEDIQNVQAKLEDEARTREEMEAATRAMNKYVEECRHARLDLDKKLGALQDEAAFLKKNHEEEVAELLEQIQGAQVRFEGRDTLKADVTSALREIRAQLDGHATKSATQAEEWFEVRMQSLSEAAQDNTEAIRSAQEEISEYRRQLQSRTVELETLRGTKESLERQRMNTEDRHHEDLNSMQESIHQLTNELNSTKWEMANQLRDYQELLNVKMALDIEIASYRKLLEGEETRFVSGMGPYSYLKLKGEEMSDTVILEEQTDETQVTEDAEEGDEEGEDKGDEEEGDEAKAERDEGEEEGDEATEEQAEGDDKEGEDKGKDDDPESKSPKSKSPMPKSPAKSPAVKSPATKSPQTKTPEPKSPFTKEPSREDKTDQMKEEEEDKHDPKSKAEDKSDKPDVKKDKKPEEASKKAETPKPAKQEEDKPSPKSPAKAKKEDEKTSEKAESKKEEKKPTSKAADTKDTGKTEKPSSTEAKEEKAKK